MSRAFAGQAELPGATGTTDGGPTVHVLEYPTALRDFRTRQLSADGYFTPDIAFSIRTCPKCKNPYVFGVFPRLTRTPYDSLAAVHASIDETWRKPTPKSMYSPRAGKIVPRACPYCGEPEHNARADQFYFFHQLADTGDDVHIEYSVKDGKLGERVYYRSPRDGATLQVTLADEKEETFRKSFGCHFSIRALWNELFKEHWNDETIQYVQAAPGMWLIFRPEKVSDSAFKAFGDEQLVADKKNGVFNHIEPLLKIETTVEDKNASENNDSYLKWAPEFAERFTKSRAECFVCVSLPEMRSMATAVVASRRAVLNLSPTKPANPGTGFIRRGPLFVPISLGPLVKLAAQNGLSLYQAGAYYLGEGCFALDNSERLGKALQAAMPECGYRFDGGRTMIARDKNNEERRIDLIKLSSKLDPSYSELFGLYRDRVLRWDAQKKQFGNPPLDREISPVGLPAFVERRIRPPEHLVKHNAPGALFEPFFDSDGKRCDLCYTCECVSTVVYIDPGKPQFADIPDVDAARRIYYGESGELPTYIDAVDVLRFPGGLPGLVECPVPIVCGSDVSSLASEASRASALAKFVELPDVTRHVHVYALSTNCAALSARKLLPSEVELLRSRAADFATVSSPDPGPELNLYFDLSLSPAKGRVLRRKN